MQQRERYRERMSYSGKERFKGCNKEKDIGKEWAVAEKGNITVPNVWAGGETRGSTYIQ